VHRDTLRQTCVFHLLGYAGHVVHSSVFGAQNIDTLIFMLVWDRCSFHKKHVGTSYVELLFLHPVGFAGHIVYCGASRKRNINALFFMLVWDHYIFQKKGAMTCYAERVSLHPVGYVGHVVDCGSSGWRNVDELFFLARLGLVWIPQKRVRTPYAEFVFLHPWYLRVTWTHYFSCSVGTSAVSINSASGQVTSNLCFCTWWDMWVT
jgi:hypothetical protein